MDLICLNNLKTIYNKQTVIINQYEIFQKKIFENYFKFIKCYNQNKIKTYEEKEIIDNFISELQQTLSFFNVMTKTMYEYMFTKEKIFVHYFFEVSRFLTETEERKKIFRNNKGNEILLTYLNQRIVLFNIEILDIILGLFSKTYEKEDNKNEELIQIIGKENFVKFFFNLIKNYDENSNIVSSCYLILAKSFFNNKYFSENFFELKGLNFLFKKLKTENLKKDKNVFLIWNCLNCFYIMFIINDSNTKEFLIKHAIELNFVLLFLHMINYNDYTLILKIKIFLCLKNLCKSDQFFLNIFSNNNGYNFIYSLLKYNIKNKEFASDILQFFDETITNIDLISLNKIFQFGKKIEKEFITMKNYYKDDTNINKYVNDIFSKMKKICK